MNRIHSKLLRALLTAVLGLALAGSGSAQCGRGSYGYSRGYGVAYVPVRQHVSTVRYWGYPRHSVGYYSRYHGGYAYGHSGYRSHGGYRRRGW